MRRAVADIGSNTVKYGIYECENNALPVCLKKESVTFALISRLKDGLLDRKSCIELSDIMASFISRAKGTGAVSFDIFATEGIRRASNSDEILDIIATRTDTPVELISGQKEARLAFTALCAEVGDAGSGVCIDMGGGSTEIVKFEDRSITGAASIPFGCRVPDTMFRCGGYPNSNEINAIEALVARLVTEKAGLDLSAENAFLLGGTALALEKLSLHIFGQALSMPALEAIYDMFANHGDEMKQTAAELVPERADTIFPGLTGCRTLLQAISPEHIRVCKSGAREGYLLDRYGI